MKAGKVVGITAAGCLIVLCVAAGGFVFAARTCFKDPENVTVGVQAPVSVATGSRFDIIATVTNRSSSVRTLVDLDVADDYLKGVAIESSEPAYKTSTHIPIDDKISYHFGLTIPANGTVQVRFKAFAAYAGDYAGDVDFCIDHEMSCTTQHVRTIVR